MDWIDPAKGRDKERALDRIWYILLTAIGLTPGGSSTDTYEYTHKQYTEQHNEAEYTEQNIHNNKNTYTQQ